MVRFGSAVAMKPVERVMVFIDGGYLRQIFREYFGDDNINWRKLPLIFQAAYDAYKLDPFQPDFIRIYYYDGIVSQFIHLSPLYREGLTQAHTETQM